MLLSFNWKKYRNWKKDTTFINISFNHFGLSFKKNFLIVQEDFIL